MKETGVRYTDCRFSLARQLGALGYTVLGYHGNEDMYGRYASHTNLGYTWKQYQTGLELEMTADGSTYAWPQSDVYVAKTSMEDYLSLDGPFHVYYMTISGHMPITSTGWRRSTGSWWSPCRTARPPRHIWPPPSRRTGCSRP